MLTRGQREKLSIGSGGMYVVLLELFIRHQRSNDGYYVPEDLPPVCRVSVCSGALGYSL